MPRNKDNPITVRVDYVDESVDVRAFARAYVRSLLDLELSDQEARVDSNTQARSAEPPSNV